MAPVVDELSRDELIEWLKTPDGRKWSQSVHNPIVHYLISLKEDR